MRSSLALVCSHRPACPGCPRFGERGLPGGVLEELTLLGERGGLSRIPVTEGARAGFRHRARLAVRGRTQNPKIGIFEAGTHRVVHIPNCQVHHPLINEVARVVRRAMVEQSVPPYSDNAHQGSVRYLQIVVERSSQSAQLVVITREASPAGFEAFFESIVRELGPRLHSLWWNGQPERSNNVLGAAWQRIHGPESVVETLAGTRLHYPPGAFGQSHLSLAESIATRVSDWVPAAARVVEFYAGVGALSLPLVERLAKLDLNEIGEGSLGGLALATRELPAHLQAKIEVHAGAAGQAAALVSAADVVLVDPPRKGLDPELLAALLQTPPARLIYVSCGLPSLLRESEALLGSGKFVLTALEAFALFPYTDHVETFAVFEAHPHQGADVRAQNDQAAVNPAP